MVTVMVVWVIVLGHVRAFEVCQVSAEQARSNNSNIIPL